MTGDFKKSKVVFFLYEKIVIVAQNILCKSIFSNVGSADYMRTDNPLNTRHHGMKS